MAIESGQAIDTSGANVARPDVFAGAGAMRAQCRALNWATTPLGAAESWSLSLRTLTTTLLGTAFPMVLLWGPELIQIYNDAYVPLLASKHPAALGQPTRECWPEVWHINAPIFARVHAGASVSFEDARYPVERHGVERPFDDLYVTISYSPVPDDAGRVGGVLVTCVDTTAQVNSRAARAEAEVRAATLAAVIESMPDGVFVRQPEGITLANHAALEQLGVQSLEALRAAVPAISPVSSQPLESVFLDPATGAVIPLVASPVGRALHGERSHAHFLLRALGAAAAADAVGPASTTGPRPVRVAAAPIVGADGVILGAVAVLTDMTRLQAAAAERERLLAELNSERTLLRTVLDQMPVGVFIVDAPSGRILALNDAVARIWGEPRPHTGAVDRYSDDWVGYHPDGRRIASAEWPVARAVLAGETVTDWVGEIERPDGARVTVEISATPVRDAAGRNVAVVAVAADITSRTQAARERERLLRELEVERARLSYVFRQAPAFLAVFRGPTHVFELVNAAYTALIGGRQVVGQTFHDALPEVRDQGFIERLDRVLATGEPFLGREVPVVLQRTPGTALEERFVDYSYLPVVEADGTRSGVIAHGNDVTAQVHARREIERLLVESEQALLDAEVARGEAEVAQAEAEVARTVAQAANRSKGEFLAVMSHELRTPLNAIGGYVELIELGIRGPVTLQQREDLARIQRSQRHLLGLINGVLNYSRAEAGAVHYDIRDVPLDAVLATCETLILPQARAKRIALELIACNVPLTVRADQEKLQQVVVNLLSNAVKFTGLDGVVTLACGRDSRSGRGAGVFVTVTDTGRGIAADALERIFEPFVQVDTRLTRTEEGMGLGLAISRDLARGMGGDLNVESTLGVGSTFTLTMPAVE